jgi:hypothetical protein
MAKRDDDDDRKLRERVEKAKPGFVPVRKVRGAANEPAAPVNSGTPDTPVLKSKAEALSDRTGSEDAAQSTEALRRKFLPGLGDDNPDDAPNRRARSSGRSRATSSSPEIKGTPRIVNVRSTRGADSDEGVPPKDLQIVLDDEGPIGESS